MKHTARAKLRAIRAALTEYHHELDTRKHGGLAAHHFVDKCQTILKMPWIQGATLKTDVDQKSTTTVAKAELQPEGR